MTGDEVTARVDDAVASIVPWALRVAAGLLWLSNVSWKVPPDFGRSGDSCRGLCGFVADGAAHGVVPGSSWMFEELVQPNLALFGWVTLLVEAALAATLLAGRYVRVAAIVGVVQSAAIGLAVANADGEWYWSYALMVLLHLAVLHAAPAMRPTSPRWSVGLLAAYGIVVALAHTDGFTDTAFTLFDGARDLPDDFGRNVFPGSVALGLLLVGVAGAVAIVVRLAPSAVGRVGTALVVLSAALLATYGTDGLLIGLGSRASTVSVTAAVGLTLWRATDRGAGAPDRARDLTLT